MTHSAHTVCFFFPLYPGVVGHLFDDQLNIPNYLLSGLPAVILNIWQPGSWNYDLRHTVIYYIIIFNNIYITYNLIINYNNMYIYIYIYSTIYLINIYIYYKIIYNMCTYNLTIIIYQKMYIECQHIYICMYVQRYIYMYILLYI